MLGELVDAVVLVVVVPEVSEGLVGLVVQEVVREWWGSLRGRSTSSTNQWSTDHLCQ